MHLILLRARSIVRLTMLVRLAILVRLAMLGAAFAVLSACGDDGSGDSAAAPPGSTPPPTSGNSAPTITGSAPTTARVGEPYTFQPFANDTDGDALQFTATGLPPWASLDASTGRLTGTPTAGEEGTSGQITIAVSDGREQAALPPFRISVAQMATGTATLSWLPPTDNADGTPLTDLAGYRIVYGRNPADLDQSIAITNPSINAYVVERLSPGTWHFEVIALNATSVESAPSNLGSKTIT